jgi:hypothetical protein
MTDRDELVRKMQSQIGDDVREIYSHEALFKAAAARIEADGKLIAEIERSLTALAIALHAKHYPEVTQWRAATGDLMLLIDQIDNMTTGLARAATMAGHLRAVLNACDQGRMLERCAGGMTIEAQVRRSVYNGVPAWPIEDARTFLDDWDAIARLDAEAAK